VRMHFAIHTPIIWEWSNITDGVMSGEAEGAVSSGKSNLSLLVGRRRCRRFGSFLVRGRHGRLFHEEAVIVEIAIQPPGDLGGFRAEGGASAAQENHGHDLVVV